MHIDKSGCNTLVAQECLNHSQMNTGLHKMGSVRMPQRVAAHVLAYIALPQGCTQLVVMVLASFLEAKSHIFGRCSSQ